MGPLCPQHAIHSNPQRTSSFLSYVRPWALFGLALIAMPLSACSTGSKDMTNSIATAPPNDARRITQEWGEKYKQNPHDKRVILAYAQGLRTLTQYEQATAVLQKALIEQPNDLDLLAAYGKALLDAGRLAEAADVLSHAQTAEQPNWTVLSAQGAVADQMGNHSAAQNYYQQALKIVPDEPSIMSNLGLSYALSRRLNEAEEILTRAANLPNATPRIRQNLALVLALEGKFKQAEELSQRDMPADQAHANVEAVRATISQKNSWRDLATAQTN